MAQRILIVDDSGFSRKMIRYELEAGGFEVMEAAGCTQALKAIASRTPDLITMDVNMPGVDGFQTSLFLREYFRKQSAGRTGWEVVPIIFITSSDTMADRERGFEAGASDFIVKPFPNGVLLEKVRQILRPVGEWVGLKALVVDDSEISRAVVHNTLHQHGIEVIEAQDGEEGLALAKAHAGEIGLIIADFMMPKMGGDQLCEAVKRLPEFKDVPFIMLSGMSERAYILKMFRIGVDDYVVKPFAAEEMFARISIHLKAAKLQRELQGKIAELERANHAKNELLAMTSHDLRSPLTGILGYCQMMAEGELPNEDRAEVLKKVLVAGKQLTTMLDDLMALGRLLVTDVEMTMEPLALEPVIQDAIDNIAHRAAVKKIEVGMENQCGNGGMISGDRHAVTRIIDNLLSNAIKFTPGGGNVTVTLREAEDAVQILVQDSGIGIPAGKMAGMFEVYPKSSRSGTEGEPGTGLGMSISKKLMEQHNGQIRVTSTVGQGTAFQLIFPALQDPAGKTV